MKKKTKDVKIQEIEKPDLFHWDFEPAQMDLLLDINEDFFTDSNELIKRLAQNDKNVASKLKRYVDLLMRLHGRYVSVVNDNDLIHTKIKHADEKLQLALETTATSEEMFEQLRVSLAEAWRENDAAMQRNVMYSLQEQKKTKNLEVNRTNISLFDEEDSPLMRLRPAVFRERDRLNSEMEEFEKRLEMSRYYCESLESIIAMNKDAIAKQQLNVRRLEGEKMLMEYKWQRTEEACEENFMELQREESMYRSALADIEALKNSLMQKTREFDALRLSNEQLTRDHLTMVKRFSRLSEEKNTLKANLISQNDQLIIAKRKLTNCSILYGKLQQDFKKSIGALTSTQRKLQVTSRKVADLNEVIQTAKNKETGLEKKLYTTLSQLEDMTLLKDDMMRSRNKADYNIVNLNNAIAGMKHESMMQQIEISNLHLELEKANKRIDEKTMLITKIINDKNGLLSEINVLNDNIKGITEQLEMRSQRITILNEQLQSKHQDYLSVKKNMETIHSEKVLLRKRLELVTRDRLNTHNINMRMNHQINQLGHEISLNEKCISEQKLIIENLSTDLQSKQSGIMNLEHILQMTRKDLREVKIKTNQAYSTINADEARIIRMNIELEEIRKQKNLVGLQMVRRNGEVVLLQDRLRIMETALDRGDIQYNQKLEDFRLLKLEIKNLRMSNECLMRAARCTANMRNEILRLERELTHERLRASALVEELQRPCRIHRWRLLRGNDPHKYELIRKIQVLLKRNLNLNIQKTNLQNKINEIKFMYDKLSDQLKLVPDPSIKQHLNEQQAVNRKQTSKIKALKAEQAINEIEIKKRDCIIDTFQRVLKDLEKRKHFKYQLTDQFSFCTTPPCEPIVEINRDMDFELKLQKEMYER